MSRLKVTGPCVARGKEGAEDSGRLQAEHSSAGTSPHSQAGRHFAFIVILLRLGVSARRSPNPFERVAGRRIVWIEAKRVFELISGFLDPALSDENSAQIALCAIVLRIQTDGVPERIFGAGQ